MNNQQVMQSTMYPNVPIGSLLSQQSTANQLPKANEQSVVSLETASQQQLAIHSVGNCTDADQDDEDDLMLGGFPQALSVQRSSKGSTHGVAQYFDIDDDMCDDDDEFIDVQDSNGSDIVQQPSVQVLAQ